MKWYGYLGILIMLAAGSSGFWTPAAFGDVGLVAAVFLYLVLPMICGYVGGLLIIIGRQVARDDAELRASWRATVDRYTDADQ